MQKPILSKKLAFFLITTCLFSIWAIWIELYPGENQGDLINETLAESSKIENQIKSTEISQQETTHKSPSNDQIPVYLVGAVQNPGVYHIERGSYLYELVELAGGLASEAASEEINLAMQINENCRIQIPTRTEFANNPDQGLLNDPTSTQSTLIHVNRATVDELDTLPGIGPATAKSIVDYRNRNGPYQVMEDLTKVPGIKQSRLDAIADLISLK